MQDGSEMSKQILIAGEAEEEEAQQAYWGR